MFQLLSGYNHINNYLRQEGVGPPPPLESLDILRRLKMPKAAFWIYSQMIPSGGGTDTMPVYLRSSCCLLMAP